MATKYKKWPQTIPNDNNRWVETVREGGPKKKKRPQNMPDGQKIYPNLPLQVTAKVTKFGFWFENMPSGNPGTNASERAYFWCDSKTTDFAHKRKKGMPTL
jgi:hypothetical protein